MLIYPVRGQGKWLYCSLRSLFLYPSHWLRCHALVLWKPSPYLRLHSPAVPLQHSGLLCCWSYPRLYHSYIPIVENQPWMLPLHHLISHLHQLSPAAPNTCPHSMQSGSNTCVSFPSCSTSPFQTRRRIAMVLQSRCGILLTEGQVA